MTVVTAYCRYMKVAYFAALCDDFDFDADYAAYCAVAAVDVPKLQRMTKVRRGILNITAKQVKFTPVKRNEKHPERIRGSFAFAQARYYAAKEDFYKNFKPVDAPLHLSHMTGKQATTKAGTGTLTAHFTVERPKHVQSPFGDADNSPVFS